MEITLEKLRPSMFLLFLILFWSSCTLAPVRPQPRVYTVEIRHMKFQSAELKVHKGDTVVFINRDFVTHDVTEESSKSLTSSPLPVGKSWSLAVAQSSNYYCSIHQVMKGKIVVE